MNYFHDDHAADGWWLPVAGGEEDMAAAAGSGVAGMLGGYSTRDGLFELVWQGGGGSGSGASEAERKPAVSCVRVPPAVSCFRVPPRFKPPEPVTAPPEVLQPRPAPSEDDMAAWLRAIVKGEEHASDGGGGGGGHEQTALRPHDPAKGSSDTSTATRSASPERRQKLAVTEDMVTMDASGNDPGERRKATGRERRSHHGDTHNLTEKRRRHKINEKLKTLQQLVPGCDKQSNHASTLDQTIQYMKALQQQVQAMSVGTGRPPPAAEAAVYPVVQPQYVAAPMVLGAPPAAMVPFGHMLQMPHYPTMMMPAAAAPPMYPAPAAAAPRTVLYPWSSSAKGKGGSSSHRRQK
ncbi:hypothetical protein ACP4OV_022910 [Aristida adscensionis]